MKRSHLLGLFTLVTLIAAALAGGATELCSVQQDQGIPCLDGLRPVMDIVIRKFDRVRGDPRRFYQAVVGAPLMLLVMSSLLALMMKRRRLALLLSLPVLPIAAEGCVLLREPNAGIAVHLAGLLYLCLMLWRLSDRDPEPSRKSSWGWGEVAGFSFLALLLTVMRFYLLNRIPHGWDTEMCPDRHYYFRSLGGLMNHEAGWSPQTSLGPIWLFLNYAIGHLDEPDSYYLYTRFLGTALSVLKFVALFCCTRALFGVFPAFLAIILLGFGPPEDWWSREPNFHHLPGIFAIVMVWACVRALEHRRWRDFVLLTLLVAGTRFLYPSGLFLGFIPATLFGLLVVFRWGEWKRHSPKAAMLLLGLGFWYLWRSIARAIVNSRWELLPPFDVPSHSALPAGLFDKLYVIFVRNGLDALSAIFVRQVHTTHWTMALTFDPPRSVTSIVIVLAIVALARFLVGRAGTVGLLLMVSVWWTLVPGITTEVADRRIGAVFVVLIIIAAREAAYLTQRMSESGGKLHSGVIRLVLPLAALVGLGGIGATMRFNILEAEPHQVTRGQLLREALEDGTLAVYLTNENGCESFYGVYRELKNRQCRTAWEQPEYEGPFNHKRAVENPGINTGSWVYKMTDLSECLPHYPKQWKRVVFLMNENRETPQQLEELRAKYPAGIYQEREKRQSEAVGYKIFTYTVDFPTGTPVE